jgi:hypothetical protein
MNHTLFKGLLFLCAGAVYYATGTTNLDKLGGLSKKMPKTSICFLIGAFSISGLPPFNGFVSKWMIYQAAFEHGAATGNFFYSTAVSEHLDSKIDITAMDALIQELADSGVYLIARLPALRDRDYGLHHVSDGVFDTRGAYLFVDEGGCYWLNPSRQGTITYLVQIVTELKNLGFDEVVFDEFRFPDTKYMRFDGDKDAALAAAAKTLVTSCATDRFAVSFVQDAGFGLPEGRSRLYIKSAVAADAAILAQQSGLADPATRLVFLTEVHDTRFDAYSVLRPLDAAH